MSEPWHRLQLLVALGFALVLTRLGWLQLQAGPELARQARQNATRHLSLAAARGAITDRLGRQLVSNAPGYSVSLVAGHRTHHQALLTALAQVLELSPERVRQLSQSLAEDPSQEVPVLSSLDRGQLARLAELSNLFPEIRLEEVPGRHYPYGSLACHTLGHLGQGETGWEGREGLEFSQQERLEGVPGERIVQVDSRGKVLRVLSERPPRPGKALRLTLDLDLQRVAEKALSEQVARRSQALKQWVAGAAVAIEPDTGKVRALVSLPGYEPEWFLGSAPPGTFERLFKDPRGPLVNRAVGAAYPPASTFKLVTTMAALEAGKLPNGRVFHCGGALVVGGLPFHCFVRSGHGSLRLESALAQSCDVVFYQLGRELGPGPLAKWSKRLGLGSPTGICLPGEVAGNVPTPEWKKKETGTVWFPGDDANFSIGQGFLTVTPLQMAVLVSSLVNGGKLIRPRLLEDEPLDFEQLDLPAHPRLLAGLRKTALEGTARGVADDLELSGKTGTVENFSSFLNPLGANHVWFVGYAPVQRPKLVVVVFLERSGGYGGSLAAPVAAAILRAWRPDRK
ncbi:MAG: penicillin-binding protein 2 [Candidatus Eremiobacteraeota bacterium]|nr:penicillin-binding protein 2 [Candidatus Eremiobacteraeota bacterium]